jgi:hypothetical protein
VTTSKEVYRRHGVESEASREKGSDLNDIQSLFLFFLHKEKNYELNQVYFYWYLFKILLT